jgi:hypothetical protein
MRDLPDRRDATRHVKHLFAVFAAQPFRFLSDKRVDGAGVPRATDVKALSIPDWEKFVLASVCVES